MIRHRIRMPAFSKIVAIIAIAAGGAAAFALPAGAGVSTLSPAVGAVQIGSPAVLEARGAALTVPITIVCAPSTTSTFISVEVVQRVGGQEIARGNGFVQMIACTGNFQSIDVIVTAQSQAFRKGEAFGSAFASFCDFSGCLSATDQREIRIER
jgi:hypothetical protein